MGWEIESSTHNDFQELELPGKIGKAGSSESVDWMFVGAVVLIIATL
jgi:hypothetical protein